MSRHLQSLATARSRRAHGVAVSALLAAGLAVAAAPVNANTPRRAVDVTVDGLTCSTFVNGNPSGTLPVPGTSSVRARFTVPTVVTNSEDVTVRDLKVDLTTNAGAALATQGGFTSIAPTTQAVAKWNVQPNIEFSQTTYGGPEQPIGGAVATNVFSTPPAGTTGPTGYAGWTGATTSATGTTPAVATLSGFKAFGPAMGGAPNGSGSIDCVVPPGVPNELVSVPVRNDLPVITSISPTETSVLFPTIVTLRGRNFRNVRSIDTGLSGRTSAFIVNSSTQIQVLVIPTAWGQHAVRVVTPAYTSLPRYLFAKAWTN